VDLLGLKHEISEAISEIAIEKGLSYQDVINEGLELLGKVRRMKIQDQIEQAKKDLAAAQNFLHIAEGDKINQAFELVDLESQKLNILFQIAKIKGVSA